MNVKRVLNRWMILAGVVPLALGVQAAAQQTTSPCDQLTALRIPASAIGLPTRGAAVTAAQQVAAQGSGASAVGDHCLVTGEIQPVDPSAPPIRFQLALPDSWNAGVVMLGGGGFDGFIPAVQENILGASPDARSPLGRGYAVLASDGGHESASPFDGALVMNDEAYRNWIGDAVKKTHDAGLAVIRARYGRSPQHAYFLGGSTGGREGLTAASRWPGDWNGVVALYPARNVALIFQAMLSATQALAAPGAFPSVAQRGRLHQAALEACDGLDGVQDGLISDVRGCDAVFDPTTATLDGVPLRCPDGVSAGETCLSDPQLVALARINAPVTPGEALAGVPTRFPGYAVYTANTGIPSASPLQSMVLALTLGAVQPATPTSPAMSDAAQLSTSYLRDAVAQDPAFDPLQFDIARPGPLGVRLQALSRSETPATDLRRFAARGGKLLIVQGMDDLLVSPRMTEDYYRAVQVTTGPARVASFLRFYEVPGFGHVTNTTFGAVWDQLSALEGWVERGVDPAHNQIVTDTTGVPGRTRPLCLYPTWPHYTGSGDVNSAAAFTCQP